MRLPKKFVDLTRKMLEMNLPKDEIQKYIEKLNFFGINFSGNSNRLENAINKTYLLGIEGSEAKSYLEKEYIRMYLSDRETIKFQHQKTHYNYSYMPRDPIF